MGKNLSNAQISSSVTDKHLYFLNYGLNLLIVCFFKLKPFSVPQLDLVESLKTCFLLKLLI